MKVKELLKQINQMDPEAEVEVLVPMPKRPLNGYLEPITDIDYYRDQDSRKLIYALKITPRDSGRSWRMYRLHQSNFRGTDRGSFAFFLPSRAGWFHSPIQRECNPVWNNGAAAPTSYRPAAAGSEPYSEHRIIKDLNV